MEDADRHALRGRRARDCDTGRRAGAGARPARDAAAPGENVYPNLRLAGFGDVNFSHTKNLEGARGFSLGQLALHITSELSPRVTFFGEISFSARADAGTGIAGRDRLQHRSRAA